MNCEQNKRLRGALKGKAPCAGFTLIDLTVVMFAALVMIVVVLGTQTSSGNKARPERINCSNNLKQIGLSLFSWSSDHNDRFPMAVSLTNGGTMEFVSEGPLFRHFAVLSNDLTIPQMLLCAADKRRVVATNFSTDLSNSKISYFLGVDSTKSNSQMLLSGDRNLTNGMAMRNGLLNVTTNEPAGWTQELHQKQGNVGLADGSVQQFTNTRLRTQIAYSGVATNRLAMP